MDIAHLAPVRPHRRTVAGRIAVVRAARRRRGAGPRNTAARTVAPPVSAPIDLAFVARALRSRPGLRATAVGAVLAVLAHLGAGAAGIGIRPSRTARRVDVAAVAISPDAAEPIIEDVPPPPSPPPPPPQASLPARSASAPASPPVATAPSSLSSLLPALAAPGFAGFSDSGPRLGAVGGGTGPTASAVDATRPQATAAPAAVLVAARPLRRPAPRFPSAARREGRTGVVVVQLRVDEQGVVVDVRIVQSDPPGVFDAAAVESVRGWTFAPATSDGEPVPSWVRQTIRFTLEGT